MNIIKKAVYSYISQKFMNDCTQYNSLEVRKSCRSKAQARSAFGQHDIPHARGEIFINPWKAIRFARQHGFPLVVKPNVGGFSRGSYFPIGDYRTLWKAALMAKIWWPSSVVEQYLEGKNYRVLVANREVVAVIQRYAPFVTGNGADTISRLIDQENAIRKDMGLLDCMYPLQKNEQTRQFLAKQGLNLNSVPADQEQVKLFHRIALAPGGVVETIPVSQVAKENKRLMEKVLDTFDARILGIDIIMEKGIEYRYEDQQCILLEVNSRPYVKMHNYPRYGEKEDLSGVFEELDKLQVAQADVF